MSFMCAINWFIHQVQGQTEGVLKGHWADFGYSLFGPKGFLQMGDFFFFFFLLYLTFASAAFFPLHPIKTAL